MRAAKRSKQGDLKLSAVRSLHEMLPDVIRALKVLCQGDCHLEEQPDGSQKEVWDRLPDREALRMVIVQTLGTPRVAIDVTQRSLAVEFKIIPTDPKELGREMAKIEQQLGITREHPQLPGST